MVWALVALLLPGVALAANSVKRVAVLGLDAGPMSPAAAGRMTETLRSLVGSNSDMVLVAKSAVTLSDATLNFSCMDEAPGCMAEIGRELGAQILVYGRIIGGKDAPVLALTSLDVTRATVMSSTRVPVNPALPEQAATLGMEKILGVAPKGNALAYLTILQASARVYLDGVAVAQAPLSGPLALEPGRHTIKVEHDGYRSWVRTVDARAGARFRFTVNLLPDEEEPLPSEEPAARVAARVAAPEAPQLTPPMARGGRSGLDRLGWALLGTGVTCGLIGVGFGLAELNTEREFDEEQNYQRALELKDKGEMQATAANIFYGLAAIFSISGGVLLLDGGSSGSADAPQATLWPLFDPSTGAVGFGLYSPLSVP